MSSVQTKIDYEYKVSGATQAANEMGKVGDGANKAAGGLDKTTLASQQASDGLGGLILKFVSLAAAIAAARQVVNLFTSSVSLAVDANEDMNKFMVVMGDNAGMVNSRLETLADTTNRNVYELRALSSGLQDMLVPMGVERELASELSTDFTRLAIDLSSFNNVPVGEVMNALKSGMAGLSRPMRNFGVDLRMATVNQELLNMNIAGGYEAATTAERAQAIYNLTLSQSADAQGDAARTADEAANVIVGFKAAIEEAQVEIGNEFLPVIETLIPLIRDGLGDALPIVQHIAERIAEDLQRYGPLFIEIFGLMVKQTAFLVEHLEILEKTARGAAGPAVWLLAEGVEYLGDRNIEAAEEVKWLSTSLETALTPMRQYIESLSTEIEYTENLGGQVEILTNFTKDLTREQITAAMATVELNRVELMRSASLKDGITPGIQAQITALDEYVIRLKTLAGTLSSSTGAATGGGGAGRSAGREESISLLNEEALLEERHYEKTIAMLEMEMQLKDTMFAKGMERRQMELEQVNAQMEPLISAAQRSTDIMVSSLTGGFDSIKDGFKNMLQDLAKEWAKSQIMKLLFSGGAKAATGGAGFFI